MNLSAPLLSLQVKKINNMKIYLNLTLITIKLNAHKMHIYFFNEEVFEHFILLIFI